MPVQLAPTTELFEGQQGFQPSRHIYAMLEAMTEGKVALGSPVSLKIGDSTKIVAPAAADATAANNLRIIGFAVQDWYHIQTKDAFDRWTIDGDKYQLPNVMEFGEMVCYTEQVTKARDPVYFRYAVDATAPGYVAGARRYNAIGNLSNAAGTGLLLLPNCKFLKDKDEPGLVWTRIDIT